MVVWFERHAQDDGGGDRRGGVCQSLLCVFLRSLYRPEASTSPQSAKRTITLARCFIVGVVRAAKGLWGGGLVVVLLRCPSAKQSARGGERKVQSGGETTNKNHGAPPQKKKKKKERFWVVEEGVHPAADWSFYRRKEESFVSFDRAQRRDRKSFRCAEGVSSFTKRCV